MTRHSFAALASLLVLPAMAHAQDASGDPVAGEQQFNRQCVACHVVADPDGTVLAGRSARTGPNLYGITGAVLGSVDGFNYGDPIVQLGEAGEVWTEESLVAYLQDSTGWLREATGDSRARSKMSYRVRSEGEAIDIYAYLATFGQ